MTALRASKRTWPAVGIAVVLVALALVVAACGESATSTTMSSAASETTVSSSTSTSAASATSETTSSAASEKTLVDMGGNKVVVPATVNRIGITCQGGAAQEVAVLGGADKIVALPSQKLSLIHI